MRPVTDPENELAAPACPPHGEAFGTERLSTVLDGLGEAFYAVDHQWRFVFANRSAEQHFGQSRAELIGRLLWDVFPGSADTELGRRFRATMGAGELVAFETESIIVPGRWMEFRLFPTADGMGVTFRDVTERKRAEIVLRDREAELARVQRMAGVSGLEVDLRSGFQNRRSPEYLRLHGLPPDAAQEPHEAWVRRIHPEDRGRTEQAFVAAVANGARDYVAEYRIIRPSDGELRWIAAVAEIERDAEGRPIRLVGAHMDVTERKRAEEHQQLLINELNHRVKNTLATVQSIAMQSFRGIEEAGGQAAGAAKQAFEARLLALSKAHDVLTRENWEGASLREIARQAFEPYWNGVESRIKVEGPDRRVSPRTALALAMAFQELATNAVKYGALSNEIGEVRVDWEVVDGPARELHLRWEERGGPPVAAPARRGFGSRLIERSLAHELGGRAGIEFARSGVICTIVAPLS